MSEISHKEGARVKKGNIFRTAWISIEYVVFHFMNGLGETLRVMRRDANLFLGATLALLGLLNWSIGKYCDGNTADYLSCTRPEAYYYYGWFEIVLIIVGVLLVLAWYAKNRREK